MTLSYSWRLLCLSAAAFFLLNLVFGAMVSAAAPLVLRMAERTASHRAAFWLLALRLLPACGAGALVLAVCVPSYLWLEPPAGVEEVGIYGLSAAGMGILLWLLAGARVLRAAIRSRRLVRGSNPCLAMAGIVRPRLILSRTVVDTLTADELAVALRHERAHWGSRDNLKRLLVLMAPGWLPPCFGFHRIERAWEHFTEWAADDRAVEGNPQRSLSLAAALIRMSRLQTRPPAVPLATTLLGDGSGLAARVDRLLNPKPPAPDPVLALPAARAGAWIGLAAALLALLLHPATLALAHSLLERLME